jgi:tetratricopeptide (TPR) repeat protein
MIDDDGKFIRQLIKKSWIEGFYLVETHHTGNSDIGNQTAHTPMRLFQRRPNYCWQGIVHEQLLHEFPVWFPERFQQSPIRVNHYGYLQAVSEDRGKRDRNLSLLMQQVSEKEHDSFVQFNIGSEYASMQDWHSARPWFERALEYAREEERWQTQQFAPMMVSRLVSVRRYTGDGPGATELIDEALGWWPDFTDLLFERALINYERGDRAAAELDIRRCIEMGDAPARYVAVQGRGSHQARMVLASFLQESNQLDEARQQLEQAFADAPHYLPLVLDLAVLRLRESDPEVVAQELERELGARGNTATARLFMATAFYEMGHLDFAERYYRDVLVYRPSDAAAHIGLAEIALSNGNPAKSIELCKQVDQSLPFGFRAARTWFLAAVIANDTAELGEALNTIVASPWPTTGERVFYTAWHGLIVGTVALVPPSTELTLQLIQNLEALARLHETDAFEVLAGMLDQAIPDERERLHLMGDLYLRRRFADMAAEEFIRSVERFGPAPDSLTGLGKAATIKGMWEDAEVLLSESLELEPNQSEARRLLELVRQHVATA